MKKILLFACISLLFGSCEKVEIIEKEYPQGNLPYDPNDPFYDDGNDNEDDYPHGENNRLIVFGGWSYSSDSGVLILPIKAELPEGLNPDYVAIKLRVNGEELKPQDYWHFDQDSQNPRVWRRNNQIDLQEGQTITGELEISLYVLTENGNPPGFTQIDRMYLPF